MSNGLSFAGKIPIASIVSSLPGNYLFLLPDAPNFTIIDATDQYCAATFTRKQDLIGRPLFEVFPENIPKGKNIDTLRASFMKVIETKTTHEIPLHQYNIFNPVRGEEEDRYWALTDIPVLDDQGEVSVIIHVVADKTEEARLRISERQAHESLKEKDRFYNMLMHAPLAMCVLEGKELIISSANKMILTLWDQSEDVVGQSLYKVLPEFKAYQNSVDIIKAYRTGEIVYGYEQPFTITTDDEPRTFYLNYVCQPIMEEADGKVSAVLVMVYDVTRQVLATRAVEESEQKLRSLIETSTCAISFMSGRNLIIELANKPALQSLNAGPEVIGKSLFELIPEPERSRFRQQTEFIFNTGQSYTGSEVLWENQDTKEERFYTYTISPLKERQHGLDGAVIIATEVTEDVLIKQRLREEEERLKAATEAAELGFWDYDFVTGSMAWDKRCKELFGLPPDAYIDYNIFLARTHPDDREHVERMLNWACEPESGGTYDVEHRTVADSERWVRCVGKVLFDEQRKPVRYTGTILDITDKKQEEIRKNDFTAMASHELKTPLTSVKAYIQILLNSVEKFNDSFLTNSLRKIETQLNKMTKMINDFLDLSRMESGRFILNQERFELNDLIEEIIEETNPLINTHTVSFARGTDIYLSGDRQKIGEVVQNFLSNAAKYSPNSKLINLRVTKNEDSVTVRVIDRGIGISMEDQSKVFQRFFRSKKASQQGFSGFGIGLYIASEIIQRHNGTIGVISQEDSGSEFHFTLPLAE